VRKGIVELAGRIAALPGIDQVVMRRTGTWGYGWQPRARRVAMNICSTR